MIRDPKVTQASLYHHLKKYWTEKVTSGGRGEEAAQAIVSDLNEYLNAYKALVGEWRPPTIEPECRTALQKLRYLDTPEMMYPYLMQLMKSHLDEDTSCEDFLAVVDTIESFIIRRIFGGFSLGGMQVIFRQIWDTVGADSSALAERLGNRFPNDSEFMESVKNNDLYSKSRCRYVLAQYERGFDRGDISEWDPRDITADHLMPQDIELEDWPGVSRNDHKELVDTWANLVPLSQKANSEKSSKSWSDVKVMMLEESGTVFKSTRDVFARNESWDAQAIRSRAEDLARWAVDRWPKG